MDQIRSSDWTSERRVATIANTGQFPGKDDMQKLQSVIPALSVLALVACSKTTGNEGNLQFSYVTDQALLDFNKPIAVGARLDLNVQTAGTGLVGRHVTVTDASTDSPSVLRVVAFSGNVVTLEGASAGNALVAVKANDVTGKSLPDSVNMTVRVPEVLRIAHICIGGTYMTGSTIYLPFFLQLQNGSPVIGYGYYPVTSSSESTLRLDPTWNGFQFMRLLAPGVGKVRLTSQIDATTLDFSLVSEPEINGVLDPKATSVIVGQSLTLYVLPSVGGTSVCQSTATVTFASLTPSICTVSSSSPPASADQNGKYETGWFGIRGVAPGQCRYTATYPKANKGVGVTGSFATTVTVQ